MNNYIINDDWDWVTHFENKLAEYTGYKYAIACDSNSNAIRLILHYLDVTDTKITIPAKTYVSVPNQIILSGNIPVFEDIEWDGIYPFGGVPIIDAATGLWKDMVIGYEDYFMVLSFHIKKILNIGTGGMILTNDVRFEKWARPMIYDGRHKDIMYDDDQFECIGWHMYMSPEQAKRGLEIFNSPKVQSCNKSVGGSWKYKDLREQKIYERYKFIKRNIE
jgi:dTDP-4-amino-4,6-dideoxygalactose transaminase